MQLHLMPSIFICDALLASWIFFENFYSKIFWMTLLDVLKYQNSISFNLSTFNKFLCSWHRNLLQCHVHCQELSLLVMKITTLRRIIIQWSIIFRNELFANSSFVREKSKRVARCNNVMMYGMRHSQKLHKCVDEVSYRFKWVYIVDIKVLDPTGCQSRTSLCN